MNYVMLAAADAAAQENADAFLGFIFICAIIYFGLWCLFGGKKKPTGGTAVTKWWNH